SRQASEAQIAAIRLEHQAKEDELRRAIAQEEAHEQRLMQARMEMGQSRKADADARKDPSPVTPKEDVLAIRNPGKPLLRPTNHQTKKVGGSCGCTWPGGRRRVSPPS
ncbi:MAG: hypothetical protein ACYC6Y_12650, partial [Thermoguttaceae bacterium]